MIFPDKTDVSKPLQLGTDSPKIEFERRSILSKKLPQQSSIVILSAKSFDPFIFHIWENIQVYSLQQPFYPQNLSNRIIIYNINILNAFLNNMI